MNHQELITYLSLAIEHRDPVLIEGPPGIGKTAIPEQVAAMLGYDFLVMQATNLDMVSSTGLPLRLEDGTADFLAVGIIKKVLAARRPTIFLMDEWDKAPISAQPFMLSLYSRHTRMIGNVRIPDCVSLVGATNTREHGIGSAPFMEPLKSRVTIVSLESSLASFQRFCYENDVDTRVPVFLQWRTDLLNNLQPTTDLTQSPCERGWHKVADQLAWVPSNLRREVFTGTIGTEAAEAFVAFLQVEESLPDPAEITANPTTADLPDDMAGRYAVAGMLANVIAPGTAESVMTYMKRLPIEFQALAVTIIQTKHPVLMETGPITDWMLDNAGTIL